MEGTHTGLPRLLKYLKDPKTTQEEHLAGYSFPVWTV
jgi:hypothetical protein